MVRALGVIGILLGALLFGFVGSLWGGSVAGAGSILTAGADGAAGATGPAGADGADGSNGLDGADGAPGQRGLTGRSGLTGIQGPRGLTGAAGGVGAQGDKGDRGERGPEGPQGDQGPAGAPGPPVGYLTNSAQDVSITGLADETVWELVTLNDLPAGAWLITAQFHHLAMSTAGGGAIGPTAHVECYLIGPGPQPVDDAYQHGVSASVTNVIELAVPTSITAACDLKPDFIDDGFEFGSVSITGIGLG